METLTKKSQPHPILCCSNLSPKTSASDLKKLFEKVAEPTKITLKPKTNGTLVATVQFESLEDCENIISEFNYYSLYNKQMNLVLYDSLVKAPLEGNIVVKNLPENLNSRDLDGVFKMFGQIVRCMVASDADGKLLGYGYVQYKNVESAKKAVMCCKSVKLGQKILEVRAYDPKIRDKSAKVTDFFTNCFVKNFPLSMTSEKLKELLEKYGKITSLHFPLRENGQPVGFACANFEKPEQARDAIASLHNKQLFTAEEMGKEEGLAVPSFYIQRAEEKENRMESLKRQLESLSIGGMPARCNLYVSNIPDTFTKEEILGIFSQFGKITDFKISEGAPGGGKMYGYVCYSTPEEACLAVEKVDGSYLDGSKLQIAYYKTKQERKAEQEVQERATKENSHSAEKNSSFLYEALVKSADKYKRFWKKFRATDAREFAMAVVRALGDLPEAKQRMLAEDASLLETQLSELSTKPTAEYEIKSKKGQRVKE